MLQTSMSTRYEVYEPGMMATPETVANNGISLKQLVITVNDGSYVFEFGPHMLIMICFTIAAFRVIDSRCKKEYIFFLIVGILSTFMATKLFPWKYLGSGISMIQFPWRMMTISNFAFSIICSINLAIVIKKFNFRDAVILGIIAVIYACALNGFVPRAEEVSKVEDLNIGFVSGRKGEAIVGMGKGEYLSHKAYDNLFYIATRESDSIIVLEGNGNIEDVKKEGNKLTCKLEALEDKTVFEFPFTYYPGYKVTLDSSEIEAYEGENGFLTIVLDETPKSDIVVKYTGTSMMKNSKLFSIVSVILCVVYILIYREGEKNIAKTKEDS